MFNKYKPMKPTSTYPSSLETISPPFDNDIYHERPGTGLSNSHNLIPPNKVISPKGNLMDILVSCFSTARHSTGGLELNWN